MIEQMVMVCNYYDRENPGEGFCMDYDSYDKFLHKDIPRWIREGWTVKHLITNEKNYYGWCLLERNKK